MHGEGKCSLENCIVCGGPGKPDKRYKQEPPQKQVTRPRRGAPVGITDRVHGYFQVNRQVRRAAVDVAKAADDHGVNQSDLRGMYVQLTTGEVDELYTIPRSIERTIKDFLKVTTKRGLSNQQATVIFSRITPATTG